MLGQTLARSNTFDDEDGYGDDEEEEEEHAKEETHDDTTIPSNLAQVIKASIR